jgi:hypothetical protein
MTKFDDFLNPVPKETRDLETLSGNYGCQVCSLYTETAYFNEKTGEISWYCLEKHKSTVVVG